MNIIITILIVVNIAILLYFLIESLHDLKLTQEIIDTLDMMKEYTDTLYDEYSKMFKEERRRIDKIYKILNLDNYSTKETNTEIKDHGETELGKENK